jgi:cell division protein FtsL
MLRKEKIKKNFWQRILYSQLVIIIGIVIIVLFSVGISKKMYRQHQINIEIAELKKETEKLEKNNQELYSLIDYLKSDDFLESEARTKLGLMKNGESVTVVSDDIKILDKSDNFENKTNQNNIKYKNKQKTVEISNPEKWLSYFFGK